MKINTWHKNGVKYFEEEKEYICLMSDIDKEKLFFQPKNLNKLTLLAGKKILFQRDDLVYIKKLIIYNIFYVLNSSYMYFYIPRFMHELQMRKVMEH